VRKTKDFPILRGLGKKHEAINYSYHLYNYPNMQSTLVLI